MAIAQYHRCPCRGFDNQIGRSYQSPRELLQGQRSLFHIQKVFPYDEIIGCPWRAFQEPIWLSLSLILRKKDLEGDKFNFDKLPNVMYEAMMIYSEATNAVKSYVIQLENKVIENKNKEKK